MPRCLGIIGSFLGTQFMRKISKREEYIIFYCIIITGLIQNLVNVFVQLFGFHLNFQPMLFNCINNGYQITCYQLNQYTPVLKTVTIKKRLGISTIGSSLNYQTIRHQKRNLTTLKNWLLQACKLISHDLLQLMGMVVQLPLVNPQTIFTLFALHLFYTHLKKMWNQMVIDQHLVTLF